jgi:hypothetical protein
VVVVEVLELSDDSSFSSSFRPLKKEHADGGKVQKGGEEEQRNEREKKRAMARTRSRRERERPVDRDKKVTREKREREKLHRAWRYRFASAAATAREGLNALRDVYIAWRPCQSATTTS